MPLISAAVAGAWVTAGQVLVLIGYLVSILFSYGLTLFVFVVPLFLICLIGWLGGSRLLPAGVSGRRWVAVLVSAPIALFATWVGLAFALGVMGTDHDWGWAYLADLILALGTAAGIGALAWSLLAAVASLLLRP